MVAKQKQKGGKKAKGAKPKTMPKIPSSIISLRSFQDYDRMVRDPCSGNLAHAPYAGSESAYLIRVTKNIFMQCPGTFSGPGVDGIGNFVLQIQCKTFPVYMQASQVQPDATAAVFTDTNNFLASSTVEAYRCVAACAKWVPIGPIAKRSGIIGLSSSNNPTITNLATVNFNNYITQALRRDSNGSSHHEVRFLPSSGDETFHEYTAGSLLADATTLYVSGVGVDIVSTSTTSANINGYVEFTGVYEWIPKASNGISNSTQMPPPFTTQQHQSTISDVGAYLFEGVRRGAYGLGGALVQGAARSFVQSISSLGYSRTRGPAMITM